VVTFARKRAVSSERAGQTGGFERDVPDRDSRRNPTAGCVKPQRLWFRDGWAEDLKNRPSALGSSRLRLRNCAGRRRRSIPIPRRPSRSCSDLTGASGFGRRDEEAAAGLVAAQHAERLFDFDRLPVIPRDADH
jgi:hypothetical protein